MPCEKALVSFFQWTREENRRDRVWEVWGYEGELKPAVMLGHVEFKQVKEEAKEEKEEAEL